MKTDLDSRITAALDHAASRAYVDPVTSRERIIEVAARQRTHRVMPTLRQVRPVTLMAAGLAFVAIILGGIAIGNRGDTALPAANAPASVDQSTPALVPTQLPSGLQLYSGTRRGPIVSDGGGPYIPWADRVYAPMGAYTSPRQLIGVTIAGTEFCGGSKAETVAVNDVVAHVCPPFYGTAGISWSTATQAVNIVGGVEVSLEQLVAFASPFGQLPDANDVPTTPGWRLLSDNRNPFPDGSEQTLYTVGPTSAAGGLRYFELRIWSGVPTSAVNAIGYPLVAQAITVRGVPAIIDDKEPNNVFIFWADPSGVVVSLQAFGGDRQSAIDFANGLHPADQAGFDSFEQDAVPPPLPLPRDEGLDGSQPSPTTDGAARPAISTDSASTDSASTDGP